MKKLDLASIEKISGGDGNWGDWVCGGIGVGTAIATVAKVALGPVGTAVGIGCAV